MIDADKPRGPVFAYIRDPLDPRRVVTIAWVREREAGIESAPTMIMIKYALAVNKVVRKERGAGLGGKARRSDQHCKKIGRLVAGGRLRERSFYAFEAPMNSDSYGAIIRDLFSRTTQLTDRKHEFGVKKCVRVAIDVLLRARALDSFFWDVRVKAIEPT